MKAWRIPAVVLVIGTASVVLLWWCGRVETDRAVELWVGVALVCVTLAYVLLTRDILSESRQTGLIVKGLAASTAALGEAAGQQAEVARSMLSYLQAPVLVLRVLREVAPEDKEIPVQVQNVGEGAAIWPKVILCNSEFPDNLLGDRPPHILPPQQFERDVPPDQHVAVPRPTADSPKIRLQCDDPRTGELIERVWLLYPLDEDRAEWCARPVREGEDSRP